MSKNYGETIALLEWADRKMKEKTPKSSSPKKEKDPDVVSLLMEQINKGEEAKKVVELLSKGLKKDEKKEDKKDEMTVLQKTSLITIVSLVGVPLYLYYLLELVGRMAVMVK